MKKIFSIVIIIALLLTAFAGCSRAKKGDDTSSGTDSHPAAIVKGHVENGVFKSEFLGLAIKLGKEWEFKSEDEINILNGVTSDLSDSDRLNKIAGSESFLDMQAGTEEGSVIALRFLNTAMLEDPDITEKEYIEQELAGIKSDTPDGRIESGATGVTVAGENWEALRVVIFTRDEPAYSLVICCKRRGSYLAVMVSSNYDESDPAVVFDNWYKM